MVDGIGAARPEQALQDAAPAERSPGRSRSPRIGPARRLLHRGLGYAALALAAAGVALPLVPTVPFLLVAAWAFARSDPHLLERLHRHPRFGPLLRDWQAERAIPARAKVASLTMMALSWTVVAATATGPLLPALLGVTLSAVAVYIVTRPAPRSAAPPSEGAVSRPPG